MSAILFMEGISAEVYNFWKKSHIFIPAPILGKIFAADKMF